jgi:TolA-binding protein/ABC-type branched-subunit amino acid transport system substrate-binding protein
MRYLRIIILLLSSFTCQLKGAQAQSDQELKNSYQYGKQLLLEGKYSNAKDIFYKLTLPFPNNIYDKYAYYLYSIASYQSGDKETAKTYLQKMIEKFPTFSQIDDAKYFLGIVHFDLGELKQGIEMMNTIKQSSFSENIAATKKNFLYKATTEQLKNLHRQNIQDEVLGRTLAQKLTAQRLNADEKILLGSLIQKYNLADIKAADYSNQVNVAPILKPTYNVALFLPFMQKETSPYYSNRRYQFVYDMYEGIKMAQKDLENEGVKLKLFAFDTERNDTTVQELVKKEWNSEIDLIVGPLYPNNIKELMKLAEAKKINIVNPMGNNNELLNNNPYLFSVESTPETQGTKAAEFALSNFAGKTAFIYFGEKLQDSLTAFAYQKRLEKETGYQVITQRLKSKVGYYNYLNDLTKFSKADSAHLFICTDEESKAINFVSALRSAKRGFPILTYRSWLDFSQLSFEQLEQLNVHFLMTDYILHNKATGEFQREYINRTNVFPSRFAYIGYETFYYFGKLMATFGTNFQDVLKRKSYEKGKLMAGFNFYNNNDNQCITITKFNDGELEVVNLPLMTEILTDEKD